MTGIAITTTDPVPPAGSASSKDNPDAAGRFGDALGSAVAVAAGGQPPADPTTIDPSGTEAQGTPPVASLLGAAAALAALLSRAVAGGPTSPAKATATPAPTGTAVAAASAVAASDPAAGPPAPSAVAAKAGTRSGHAENDEPDDGTTAAAASPASADGTVIPTLAVPAAPAPVVAVPVAPVPVVPVPGVSARPAGATASVRSASPAAAPVGRIVAAGRADARVGARGEDDPRERSTDAASLIGAGSPDAPSAAAAAAATALATPTTNQVSSDPSASAIAAIAPAPQVAPASSSQPVATTLVATTDPSVAQQLQGPLLSLRSAPDGDHVMVVRVSPDHLGSVTVHATVSHGDLSVQLVASSTAGHDALQSMMTDLRRDLGAGGSGTETTLSLATGDAPQQDQRGQQQTTWLGAGAGGSSSGGGSAARDDRVPWPTGTARATDDTTTDRRLPASSSALLDVLA